jgi:hypothetical protein
MFFSRRRAERQVVAQGTTFRLGPWQRRRDGAWRYGTHFGVDKHGTPLISWQNWSRPKRRWF